MEHCMLQSMRRYLTAKCARTVNEREWLIPCFWSAIVWNSIMAWTRRARQRLSNQTVSESRASHWLHGAKPQTQTHPGPQHLPLWDTSERKKTTIWPLTQFHIVAFISSLSHRGLERKGAFSRQTDESQLSQFLKKISVKVFQSNPTKNNILCGDSDSVVQFFCWI